MRHALLWTFLAGVNADCINMVYKNMQYLSDPQLKQYNMSNCTVTCNTGYYGDLCQPWDSYSNLPQGPWNMAGYYTVGSGVIRSISVDLSDITQIQYTASESVLVGIFKQNTANSRIMQISLYTGTKTLILSPPVKSGSPGTLDSVVVRNGKIYVARSFPGGTYDIVLLTGPESAQTLFSIKEPALLIEIYTDKGTQTAFIYTLYNNVMSCYPNNQCVPWKQYGGGVKAIVCGIDCPYSIYVSLEYTITKLTQTTETPSITDVNKIYCLAADTYMNVIVYGTSSSMVQVNLGSGMKYTFPSMSVSSSCSIDISELRSQIMVFNGGALTTIESMQNACGAKQTSPAIFSNSTSKCTPCPPLPDNAKFVLGSVLCEWVCEETYTKLGSWCVPQVVQPCPAYYIAIDGGLCSPSLQPWAASGRYVDSVQNSVFLNANGYAPYIYASDGTTTIIAMNKNIYYLGMQNSMFSLPIVGATPFFQLMDTPTGTIKCKINNNDYYYMSWQNGVLWAAFTTHTNNYVHCLWALNTTDPASLVLINYWQLGARLCSVAYGNLTTVYTIFCGTNSVAQLSGDDIVPITGKFAAGYSDGILSQSSFNNPSSVVHFKSRLYIADMGNCVIREVDLGRGQVSTVAGVQGVCQRSPTTLAYPFNLVNSAYDGFFLFMDQYQSETYPSIRQLHIPTFIVQTIKASSLSSPTSLVGFTDRILVAYQSSYYHIQASTLPCPPGTSANTGNALSFGGCYPCYTGYFSAPDGCRQCTVPVCNMTGQLLMPCQPGSDSYCGVCTNKPPGSIYTGPSSVPGSVIASGDCPWAYVPPCPAGYYNKSGMCTSCPPFSSSIAGSSTLTDCKCLGNGKWVNGGCVVPSPYYSPPAVCGPLSICPTYNEPSSPFPILSTCNAYVTQSPSQVCPCDQGQYIAQIYPYSCMQCPSGLYSSTGRGCQNCPMFMVPSLSQMECKCAVGSYNMMLESSTPVCGCGPGMAFSMAQGCTACPRNTANSQVFALQGMKVDCTPCNPGMVAPPGSSYCIPCGLGEFGPSYTGSCLTCPAGQYSPDPTMNACTDCKDDCAGQYETVCPTNASRLICSSCPDPRPYSRFNGNRNCTTDGLPGYYELEGVCTICTLFDALSCPKGWVLLPCTAYSDAVCMPCTSDNGDDTCAQCINTTKPLNYANWTYTPATPNGPNSICTWGCSDGYRAQPIPLPPGLGPLWECVQASAWSWYDIFTL